MASGFSAGTVYVQVLPSLNGWRKSLQRQLVTQMRGISPSVTVNANVRVTNANQLAALRLQMAALRNARANVTVYANTNLAAARLAAINATMNRLNGQRAVVTVNANTGGANTSLGLLDTRMQRIIAASIAGAGAIGGLGAGLIALAAAASVGAAGLLAVAAGATAIGQAMKAQSAASTQAGQSALQEAAQRLSAANQVLNAQDALRNAVEGVADAQVALRNATVDAAEAQRNAANSVRLALAGQARAEEALRDAQVSALRAQQDLTEARQDAKRDLEDLQNAVIRNGLEQREAVLAVTEAEENLAKVLKDRRSTERERAQAQLALEQARQRVVEVGLAYERSKVDATEAAKAGVDGAEQVVSAQDALVDAQRRVVHAEQDTLEAVREVEQARLAGAEEIIRSQQRVAQASQGVARAQQEVIQAQRSLAQAQANVTTQSESQGAAQEKWAEALEKLTPSSLRLIEYLRSQSGEWLLLSQASQGFADGTRSALRRLEPIYGAMNDNVSTMTESFGSFLEVVADGLVDSEPFFAIISSASTTLFPRFGETLNRVSHALQRVVVDMLPLADEMFEVVDAAAELVTGWSPFIAQASGPLLDALSDIIGKLDFLGPLLVTIAKPAADLTTTLVGGLRQAFLNMMPALGPFLTHLIDIVETASPLLGVLGQLAGVAMEVLTPALNLFNEILKPVVGALEILADVVDFIPSQLLAMMLAFRLLSGVMTPITRGLTAIGVGLSNVGGLAATYAGHLGAPAAATTRFATASQRAGTALSKMGQAVPILGVALIGLGEIISGNEEDTRKNAEAVDKMASALVRGGQPAEAMRRKLEQMRQQAETFSSSGSEAARAFGEALKKSADDVEAAAAREEASMTTVELAQLRLNQAQLDYDVAVRDHGETSGAAITAYGTMRDRLADLKLAQDKAAEATKSHTDRLAEQQEELLAMTDTRVAHQRAALRMKEAEERLNEARKLHGKNSTQAKEAELDLISAQSTYIATAGQAAVASAKVAGAADTTRAKTEGQRDALGELIRTQGQDLPPSILSMIAHLDQADQKFLGLSVQVDETGTTIMDIPGGPNKGPVHVEFTDNVPVIKDHIRDLRDSIVNFFDYLDDFIAGRTAAPSPSLGPGLGLLPGVAVPQGRAEGGPIGGRGTKDTVPALLTPGEFVFSRPAVDNLGVGYLSGLHQAARFARGGLVGPQRFAVGGAVSAGSAPGGGGGPAELGWLAQIAMLFSEVTATAIPLASVLGADLTPALWQLQARSGELAGAMRQDWASIAAVVAGASGAITGTHLAGLRAGLAQVDVAVSNTAGVWATRWGMIRGYAADPVRAALDGPFNRGLVAAWNTIDSAFGTGRPLAPLPIGFARGGTVYGGEQGRDSVPALLMPGEFVIPVPMVEQIGLRNLEAARRSVLAGRSAEGIIPGYEAGGAVTKALGYATAQVGKPYIWGGVGPAGFDCSGLMSAIANVILGEAPNRRRMTTADFSAGRGAGGFLPGRNSAFVIGVSDSHMAGTLAGHNVESTTKNGLSGPRVDGDASGALDGQFTKGQFFLPQAGGRFTPGPTSGRPFDLPGLLAETFASTRSAIAGLIPAFAGNTLAAQATAELSAMLDAATGWATRNIATSATAGSGPVMEQVRGVAARYGWGDGPEWEALWSLVMHESSGNPTAQNPQSSAYGLFQLLDGTWPSTGIAKTSNPALQAEAGLRYIQSRYGTPGNAWRFWQGAHWYDGGGYLPPGLSVSYNGTGHFERVRTPQQELALANSGGGGGPRMAFNIDTFVSSPTQSPRAIARELDWLSRSRGY